MGQKAVKKLLTVTAAEVINQAEGEEELTERLSGANINKVMQEVINNSIKITIKLITKEILSFKVFKNANKPHGAELLITAWKCFSVKEEEEKVSYAEQKITMFVRKE